MRFVERLILLLLLSLPSQLLSQSLPNCPSPNNKIYCAILTINPKVDKLLAFELSNYIYKYAKKYKTDPMITVAIAAQESMFRNVHRKHTVLELVEDCDVYGTCIEYLRKVRGYTDIGVYQFHAATIEAYGMDALRLRDDLDYATEQHCFLLSAKVRECADLGDKAWTCYHSRTPSFRDKYYVMVSRYLNQIQETK